MTMDPHRRSLLAALGAAGALGPLAALPALAQFRIEVTGVGATQVPMAVPAFRDEQLAGLGVSAIVRADSPTAVTPGPATISGTRVAFSNSVVF